MRERRVQVSPGARLDHRTVVSVTASGECCCTAFAWAISAAPTASSRTEYIRKCLASDCGTMKRAEVPGSNLARPDNSLSGRGLVANAASTGHDAVVTPLGVPLEGQRLISHKWGSRRIAVARQVPASTPDPIVQLTGQAAIHTWRWGIIPLWRSPQLRAATRPYLVRRADVAPASGWCLFEKCRLQGVVEEWLPESGPAQHVAHAANMWAVPRGTSRHQEPRGSARS